MVKRYSWAIVNLAIKCFLISLLHLLCLLSYYMHHLLHHFCCCFLFIYFHWDSFPLHFLLQALLLALQSSFCMEVMIKLTLYNCVSGLCLIFYFLLIFVNLDMMYLSIILIMQSCFSDNKCGPLKSGAPCLSCKRSFWGLGEYCSSCSLWQALLFILINYFFGFGSLLRQTLVCFMR